MISTIDSAAINLSKDEEPKLECQHTPRYYTQNHQEDGDGAFNRDGDGEDKENKESSNSAVAATIKSDQKATVMEVSIVQVYPPELASCESSVHLIQSGESCTLLQGILASIF